MIALSIRQPWAWMILNAGKDIENRDFVTAFRGRTLVHAGLAMRWQDYDLAVATMHDIDPSVQVPLYEELQRGGIVGSVEIVECVRTSRSPWFVGQVGWVLRNPTPLRFTPFKGRLQFFNVPDGAIA